MTKTWLFGTDIPPDKWSQIDEILATHGWSSLNPETTLMLLIEDEKGIVGFMVSQFHPLVGPAYVRPSSRGSDLQNSMAKEMIKKLEELQARGWLVVADNRHTAQLCREHGMTEVTDPVFRTQ
jgi:hypothetical protein